MKTDAQEGHEKESIYRNHGHYRKEHDHMKLVLPHGDDTVDAAATLTTIDDTIQG